MVSTRVDTSCIRRLTSLSMFRTHKRLIFLLLAMFALGLAVSQMLPNLHFVPTHAAGFDVIRRDSAFDTALGKGYRFDRGGWTYVHLEGAPHDIGVQHGYLMAQEIADFFGVVRLEATHNTGRNWDFFRRAGREMLWPKIDGEYQQELQGITDGLKDHGVKLDIWDVVAMNAFAELPDYYVPWLDQKTQASAAGDSRFADRPVSGHCS